MIEQWAYYVLQVFTEEEDWTSDDEVDATPTEEPQMLPPENEGPMCMEAETAAAKPAAISGLVPIEAVVPIGPVGSAREAEGHLPALDGKQSEASAGETSPLQGPSDPQGVLCPAGYSAGYSAGTSPLNSPRCLQLSEETRDELNCGDLAAASHKRVSFGGVYFREAPLEIPPSPVLGPKEASQKSYQEAIARSHRQEEARNLAKQERRQMLKQIRSCDELSEGQDERTTNIERGKLGTALVNEGQARDHRSRDAPAEPDEAATSKLEKSTYKNTRTNESEPPGRGIICDCKHSVS